MRGNGRKLAGASDWERRSRGAPNRVVDGPIRSMHEVRSGVTGQRGPSISPQIWIFRARIRDGPGREGFEARIQPCRLACRCKSVEDTRPAQATPAWVPPFSATSRTAGFHDRTLGRPSRLGGLAPTPSDHRIQMRKPFSFRRSDREWPPEGRWTVQVIEKSWIR